MKALSLWQPWASLWLAGVKINETRSWSTHHRGTLAVHAAKLSATELRGRIGDDKYDELDAVCRASGLPAIADLPRGAVIGVVNLVDVQHIIAPDGLPVRLSRFIDGVFVEASRPGPLELQLGDFSDGRFAWVADRRLAFERPVAVRGAQGIWTVPDSVLADCKPTLGEDA